MGDPSGRERNGGRAGDLEEEPGSEDRGWVLNSMRSRVIASCLLYTSLIIVLVAVSAPGLTDILSDSNSSLEGGASGAVGSLSDNTSLQQPQLVWNRTFPEVTTPNWVSRHSRAYRVLDSDDGGLVIGGNTDIVNTTFGSDDSDLYLLKVDAEGSKIWERGYGGPGGDSLTGGIVKSGDGGYVLAGSATIGQEIRTWVLRVDGEGNVVWNRTYAGDYARYIARTEDGGFLVGASKLFKIDPDGQVVWESPFEGGPAVEAGDGGYVVAGGKGIYKLSEQGGLLWELACSVSPSYLIKSSDGGFIGAGTIMQSSYNDAYVVTVDYYGKKLWEAVYGNSTPWTYHYVTGLFDRGRGTSLGVGCTENTSSCLIFVLEFDDRGRLAWQKLHDPNGTTGMYRAIETTDGGYLITGQYQPQPCYDLHAYCAKPKAYVLKIDSNGDKVMDGIYHWGWFASGYDAIEVGRGEYVVVGTASPTRSAQGEALVFKISIPVPELGGFLRSGYVALLGLVPVVAVGLALLARRSHLQQKRIASPKID